MAQGIRAEPRARRRLAPPPPQAARHRPPHQLHQLHQPVRRPAALRLWRPHFEPRALDAAREGYAEGHKQRSPEQCGWKLRRAHASRHRMPAARRCPRNFRLLGRRAALVGHLRNGLAKRRRQRVCAATVVVLVPRDRRAVHSLAHHRRHLRPVLPRTAAHRVRGDPHARRGPQRVRGVRAASRRGRGDPGGAALHQPGGGVRDAVVGRARLPAPSVCGVHGRAGALVRPPHVRPGARPGGRGARRRERQRALFASGGQLHVLRQRGRLLAGVRPAQDRPTIRLLEDAYRLRECAGVRPAPWLDGEWGRRLLHSLCTRSQHDRLHARAHQRWGAVAEHGPLSISCRL
mmetsp:Transcript_28430/g.54198  ORF Transcript_28430/g.54198 Transcript_28430/m.54198 type:complete len:347 (+) Transcript_28430:349-1389(+)